MRTLNRSGKIGLVMVAAIVLLTVLAPLLSSWGPQEIDSGAILQAPSASHWFGTDQTGMDVFARTLYAPRVDLLIAVVATALAIGAGIPLGILAGTFEDRGGLGGFVAQVIMRTADVVQAIPVFVFALAVVAVLGNGAANVIFALAFVNAPVFLRLTRTEVLLRRDAAFAEAALVGGRGRIAVAFRHVLPNAIGPSIGQASVVLGFSILLTAGLSFIGAGVQVPTAEWGVMISQGAANVATGQWWPALFPGMAMAFCVFALALLGEGIRDAFATGELRLRLRSRRRIAGAFR